MRTVRGDVAVVGAGPAGLAAVRAVSEAGRRAVLVDDNPHPGGQIWRRDAARGDHPGVVRHLPPDTETVRGAVFDAAAPGTVFVETDDDPVRVEAGALVLATGATERFLPFPGWTLPGVCGAGGLQALVKGGLDVADKRVVLAGTGPLLLAVADLLRDRGARVRVVVEQAAFSRVLGFTAAFLTRPAKARRTAGFVWRLFGVRRMYGAWPVRAHGETALEAISVRQGSRVHRIGCDLAGIGFGLVPETRLARLLRCETVDGRVTVDADQTTSVPGVYAAGEITGVGGVDKALAEGRIAGAAAVGAPGLADDARPARDAERVFVQALDRTFALRPELRDLPDDDTVACRCEDIAYGRVRDCDTVRDAKIRTRAGMGVCQGRVCGPALQFLRDWPEDSVRAPVFPARLETLRRTGEALAEGTGDREPGTDGASPTEPGR